MQAHDLHRAAREAAELLERLSRASQELSQSNRHSVEQLQRTAQDVPGVLRQAMDQSLGELSAQTVETVRRGLNAPMQNFERQAMESGSRLSGLVALMAQSQQQVDDTIRRLQRLLAGLAALVLVLAVGLGGVLWHYKGEVDRYRIEADLLRAYNAADVTLCEGRLCARVDKNAPEFSGYVQVRSR